MYLKNPLFAVDTGGMQLFETTVYGRIPALPRVLQQRRGPALVSRIEHSVRPYNHTLTLMFISVVNTLRTYVIISTTISALEYYTSRGLRHSVKYAQSFKP